MLQNQNVTKGLSVKELAQLLDLKTKSIYNDLWEIRQGKISAEKLPPFFCRLGSNRPIFVNVNQWVEDQLARQNQILGRSSPTPNATQFEKKRGRKTNKEKAELEKRGAA